MQLTSFHTNKWSVFHLYRLNGDPCDSFRGRCPASPQSHRSCGVLNSVCPLLTLDFTLCLLTRKNLGQGHVVVLEVFVGAGGGTCPHLSPEDSTELQSRDLIARSRQTSPRCMRLEYRFSCHVLNVQTLSVPDPVKQVHHVNARF